MELVHYLILAGAALLVVVALFPSLGARAASVVQPKPAAPLRSAFQELHDLAESRAYQQIEEEISSRKAVKLKSEIMDLFAPGGGGEKKPSG